MQRHLTRTARCIVLTIATVVVACAQDPHKIKITDANKDNYLEEIKNTKGLTVEEVGLLTAYQMRRGVSAALGGSAESPVGKTIGDLIENERKLQADAKLKEAEQKRLAAEAKAKEDRLAEELRKAINLTVFDKGFHEADYRDGDIESRILMKCAYQNTSSKDIRAFKGEVRFTDLFGVEIYSIDLTVDDPIPAGQKATWSGGIRFNQFKSEHQKLRNTELANMKVEWRPKSIIYADGTTVGTPQ